MTEINEKTELAEPIEQFVLHWGDLGSHWGVNRSIAQIHALLYLSDVPLPAESIAEQIDIARSNVSNSLKELLRWKLVRRVPVRGDRRDHYEAETDLWEVVKRIAEGRKAREVDPARAALETCAAAAQGDPAVSDAARERLAEMTAFVESLNTWYEQMLTLPNASLSTLIRMGARVVRVMGRTEWRKS